MTFPYDAGSTTGYLPTDHPALNQILLEHPQWCAAVNEYASTCSVDVKDVIDQFGPLLEHDVAQLEIVMDEIFLLIDGKARTRDGYPLLAANLWGLLRQRFEPEQAFGLWQLIRGLQRAGWRVYHDQKHLLSGLGPVSTVPELSVDVAGRPVPVLINPDLKRVSSERGVLTEYYRAGAPAVAVVCGNAELDRMVTAVRRWFLTAGCEPGMAVVILEAPQFAPTLLSARDGSVQPVSVSAQMVQAGVGVGERQPA